jgi:puromycin-sensitive aminopeptidase
MRKSVAWALGCLVVISATASFKSEAEAHGVAAKPANMKASFRLPETIVPLTYNIKLAPDLKKSTFSGSERVVLDLKADSEKIYFHSKDLKISRVTISGGAGKVESTFALDGKNDLLIITAQKSLARGKYNVDISFSGTLNEKLVGFYRSTFRDSKGAIHVLATTQMEATDCRRMIPCLDEPAMKAKFKLTVDIDPAHVAISNSPIAKSTTDKVKGIKRVEFAETPSMSTYLLALIVGEFESTEPVSVDGTPIRVWSVKGKKHLGHYSRDMAVKLLPFFNSYFKIAYPWKKLDLVAVPDFEAGAMENPGAITFRETLLLVDPQTASVDSLRDVCNVLAHEMAHMWFGDLVTMAWWDDLWLNEAFATWMATKAVDAVIPKWEYWKNYAMTRSHAMETDALQSTRTIQAKVINPDQASEMFDAITYSKGSSILRMLEMYVGESVFQEGVHQYLSKYSYGNATTADLWNSIGAVAKRPVAEIMHSWVHQPGYPLVSLESNGRVDAAQAIFLLDREARKAIERIWMIPLGMRLATSPVSEKPQVVGEYELIDKAQTETKLARQEQPVLGNIGGVGFYRTRYSEPLLASLLPVIQTRLNSPERLSLINDYWALARGGDISMADYFQVVATYKKETDYSVWQTVLNQLSSLDYYVDDKSRAAFERFLRDHLSHSKKTLGWFPTKGESDLVKLGRAKTLTLLGTLGQDPETIAQARKLFTQYVKNDKSVDPDLVDPITSIVAYNGGVKDYQTMWKLHKQARTPEISERNLMALGSFRDKALIDRTLKLSISPEVRTQDAPNLLGGMLGNRVSNETSWRFVEANWKAITSRFSQQSIPHTVGHASFSTEAQYEMMKKFFDTHPIKAGETTIARTLERVRIAKAFRKRSADELNSWLQKNWSP